MMYFRSILLLLLATVQVVSAQFVVTEVPQQDRFTSVSINAKDLYKQVIQSRSSEVALPFTAYGASTFSLQEDDMLTEDFVKNRPDIKIYKMTSIDDDQLHGRLMLTPDQVYASVLTDRGLVSLYRQPTGQYVVERDIDLTSKGYPSCGHIHESPLGHNLSQLENDLSQARIDFTNGSFKKRFRLAIVCTGEYYVLNGNSDAAVQNEIAAAVMALNVIYENELAVTFDLLDPVLFANPATDPFIPDNGGPDTRTQQAAAAVGANFPLNSYDIGHAFHKSEENDGWGSGGLARLGAVCNDNISGGGPAKAAGWSGSFLSGNSFTGIAAHEFAHMFNATHTFNGSGESCDGAISSTSAYEIGSGTTLMSYQGICSEDQNIPGGGVANHYFHVHSLFQMVTFINNQTPCANTTPTGNTPPVANANPCGGTVQIPRNTPFFLQGSGGDVDTDVLTYSWEQYDEDGPSTSTQGLIGNAAANSNVAPLFRSFPASTAEIRYFPDLATLANGATSDPFQVLSNRNRVMNFQFTVRDNNPAGGGLASDELQVEVVSNGPLTLGNISSMTAGMTATVNWNTNGTDDICSTAKLMLSVDGGATYPFTVAEGLDYSAGTTDLTLPESFPSTDQGRLMLVCDDNACHSFFDVTNGSFPIISSCAASPSYVCDTDFEIFDQGEAALNLDLNHYIGASTTSFLEQISTSDPVLPLVMFNENSDGCFLFPGATNRVVEKRITVLESGTYTFSVDFNTGQGNKIISLYNADSYNANDPCISFISSNTRSTGGFFFSLSTVMNADLEACQEYIVTLYINTTNHPQTFSVPNISGPGEVIEIDETPTPDYSTTYIAVDEDGDIEVVSPTSDFRSLSGGMYDIYTVQYKSSGTTPPALADPSSWIGRALTDIQSSDCMLVSSNKKRILVEFSCRINGIIAGTQTPCDPSSNTYTQEVIVSYESPPLNGMLQVNGVSFDITGSPQTVSLNGLISDGQPVGVNARFTALPSCTQFENALFTAPENCCGIDFDLGGDRSACDDQTITLDAGSDGVEYRWFLNAELLENETSPELTVTESGTYLVVVTNATGCSRQESVNISLFATPSVALDEDLSVCEGDFFSLPVMTDAETVQWYKDESELSGETDLTLLIIDAGQYAAVGTNTYALTDGGSLTCSDSDTINIEYVARPVVELGEDISFCEGSSPVLLDAGSDGSTYTWARNSTVLSNETSSTLTVSTSGQYSVIVDVGGGCDTRDTVEVTVFDLADISAGEDINICAGSTGQLFGFIDADSYEWIYEDQLFTDQSENPVVTEGGEYILIGYNELECPISDTVMVTVVQPPMIDLGPDRIACIGSEVPLSVDSIGTVIWRKDNVDFSTNANITVTEPGQYIVSIIAGSNCNGRDTINVDFQPGPSLDLGTDQTFCAGGSYTIMANTNGDNITWFADGEELTGQTDFDLTVTSTAIYLAVVEGATGCTVEQSVNIIFNEVPDLDLGEDIAVCDGEPAELSTDLEAEIYEWSFAGSAISDEQTLSVTTPGVYTLLVINAFGCSDSDMIEVIANATPIVSLEDEYQFCDGEQVTLTAQGDGDTYTWIINGSEVMGDNDNNITISAPADVEVIASSAAGCTASAISTVSVADTPTISLGDDIELCPAESILLDAGSHNSYAWSDGTDQPTLLLISDVEEITTSAYSVTVTNSAGCTATDEVSITFYPNINLVVDQSAIGVCGGEPVILSASGGISYQWIDESGTLSDIDGPNAIASPTETTTYQLIAMDDCPGNEATEIITIEVFEQGDDLTAGEDDCAVTGRSIELNAMGGVAYEWRDDPSIISGQDSANPTVSPSEETTYVVDITDENGCVYTDSVFICLLEDPLEFFQLISIITPNGDGDNDALRFDGLEAFPDNTLTIYNRWGYPVYEKRRYQQDNDLWNGENGGDVLPADTYYYILTFDGETYKSTITIMR